METVRVDQGRIHRLLGSTEEPDRVWQPRVMVAPVCELVWCSQAKLGSPSVPEPRNLEKPIKVERYFQVAGEGELWRHRSERVEGLQETG